MILFELEAWECFEETRLQRPGMLIRNLAEGPGVYMCCGPDEEPRRALRIESDLLPPVWEYGELLLLGARLLREEASLIPEHPEKIRQIADGEYIGNCLLRVVMPLDEGAVITATSFKETIDNGCVARCYDGIAKAVGVRIVCMSEDNLEAILLMQPGSQIRLARKQQGIYQQETIVEFTGRELCRTLLSQGTVRRKPPMNSFIGDLLQEATVGAN